jgi:hypothetical protein
VATAPTAPGSTTFRGLRSPACLPPHQPSHSRLTPTAPRRASPKTQPRSDPETVSGTPCLPHPLRGSLSLSWWPSRACSDGESTTGYANSRQPGKQTRPHADAGAPHLKATARERLRGCARALSRARLHVTRVHTPCASTRAHPPDLTDRAIARPARDRTPAGRSNGRPQRAPARNPRPWASHPTRPQRHTPRTAQARQRRKNCPDHHPRAQNSAPAWTYAHSQTAP